MALLEVTNLHKNFDQLQVLKGISFSLEKGQTLSVIGPSGGGKTTLLRCLNFLEMPTQGKIVINGQDGAQVLFDTDAGQELSPAQIRRNRLHFGLVFQNFNLFPQYTALQNVSLAPRLQAKATPAYRRDRRGVEQAIQDKSVELLRRVGLGDKLDFYPHQLSGGQQQRVAIARALALEPDILCFDEPTSALDPELTGEVLRVIRGLKSTDRTIIIVTHEMEFARSISDRVIFMADGVIEEEGSPEQVFGNPQSAKTQQFLSSSLEHF